MDNVLRTAEVIATLELEFPENGKSLTRTICTSKDEHDITCLIETDDWLNRLG